MKKTMINTMTNREKCRERAFSAVLFNVRSIVLILVMMLTTVAAAGLINLNAYAQGRTVEVATYDQLQEALENTQGVSEIVIDPQAASEDGEVTYSVEDDENSEAFYIAFDGPLTVSHDITIKNADDVDVYLARSDSFRRDQGKPALLNVDPTGTLNLEGLITFTGEEVSTTYNEEARSFAFSVKSKDGTGEDNEVWNRGQVLEGGYYIQSNGGKVNLGEDVIVEDFHTTDDVEGVEPILEKDADGRLFASRTPAEEEAVEEETEEAAEETAEATEEETTEEKTEEKAEETTPEEAPVIAPKKSLKSMKSPALMQNSQNGGTAAKSGVDATPKDPTGTKTVATYAQLKAALDDSSISTIIVDKTGLLLATTNVDENGYKQAPNVSGNGETGVFYLPVDEPLTVNRPVEIKTKDANTEVIIARSDNFTATEANPAIFNVTSSGDLTLSSKITMTGDKVKVKSYSEGQNYVAGTPAPAPITNELGNLYLTTQTQNIYTILVLGADGGYKFQIESDGRLSTTHPTVNGSKHYMTPSNQGIILAGNKGNSDIFVRDTEGNPVTKLKAGDEYLLYSSYGNAGNGGYISANGNTLEFGKSKGEAIVLKAGQGVPTGSATEGKDYIAPSIEFEVEKKLNVNNTTGKHWQTGDVKAGGFFVNVNAGKLTINDGVTLRDLHCGPNVTNVAPIVVKGDSSSSKADDGRKNFVMNGGIIKDNKIGYRGDALNSANAVKTIANAIKGSDGTGTQGNNKMTNTAGGVIFTDKATATIAGGSINGNRADAGGIIVTEEAYVKFTSGQINSNIGVHHAGAAQVEHGGTLVMDGANAEMKNNIAWYKGGAVWATEWGTSGYAVADWSKWPKEFPTLTSVSSRSNKGGGNFILNNGTIQYNTAFARAGAIEVESNGVQLNGGLIDSNYCRSLGGAIYIEGDSPNYSYSLVLPEGYITDNTAVFRTDGSGADYKDENALLDRKIGTTLDNETGSWLLTNSNPGDNSDGDFAGAMGNGGGIWLCPVGGTSVFTGGDIYIWGNDSERTKGGEDFYLHRGNGAAMLQSMTLQGDWINEVSGDTIAKNLGVVSGPLSMTNTSNYDNASNRKGVTITNNIARDGGAIACNGTFIIGKAQNVHRYNARIDMEKTWAEGTEPKGKKINLRLQYKSRDNTTIDKWEWKDLKYVAANAATDSDGNPTESVYEVDLDGSGTQIGPSDAISETTQTGDSVWKASAFLPLYVLEKDEKGEDVKTYLYTLYNPDRNGAIKDEVLDLSNDQHVGHLYSYIEENGGTASLNVKDWNLQIVESIKVGNETYKCGITYPKTGAGSGRAETITLSNPADGGKIDEFQITYSTMTFGASLTNSLTETSVELTKVRSDDTDKPIKGTKFIVAEVEQDTESKDFRVAGSPGLWNPTNETDVTKNILDVAQKDDEGNLKIYESDNDGKFTVEHLEPGRKYFLFEYQARAGYEPTSSPWLLVVGQDAAKTVSVMAIDPNAKWESNSGESYSVINKVKRNRSGDKLQDFAVIDNSNKANTTDAKNSVYRTYWNNDWFYNSDDTAKNPVTDKKLKNNVADLQITKNGTDGNPVQGAKFVFFDTDYKDDADHTTISYGKNGRIKKVIETKADGTIDLTEIIKLLNENGNASKGGVGQGRLLDTENRSLWLLMFEASVPEGYKQKTVPWLVNITNEGTVKVYEHSNPYKYSSSPLKENGEWNAAPPATEGGTDLLLSDYNATGLSGTPISTGTIAQNATVSNLKKSKITLSKYGVKTFEQDAERTSLNGVVFTLYEEAKVGDQGAVNNVEGISGYVKVVNNNIQTSGSDENKGKVEITNLMPGQTYYLKETTPHDGYIKPVKPIKFKLSEDATNSTFDWNEELDNADSEILLKYGANINTELKVGNKQLYDLPNAGGMGTYWFMVIGAMMMGFALTAGFTKMNLLTIFRR